MSGLLRRLVVAFSVRNRRRKAVVLERLVEEWGVRTVAVVGTGGMRPGNEGIIERALDARTDIVAALDVVPRPTPWPAVVGDGCRLPWRTGGVDVVVSNAVVEHVGDEAAQRAYVAEHVRAGRWWVLTTPNRWFPVESHTSAVLRHWDPRWRARRREFTRLLSRSELRDLLPEGAVVLGRPWSATFTAYGPGEINGT